MAGEYGDVWLDIRDQFVGMASAGHTGESDSRLSCHPSSNGRCFRPELMLESPAALNPIQGEGRRVGGAGEEVANHQRQDLYLTWRSGSSQQCRYLCCCCYSTAAASSSWWNGPSPISTPGWPTKSREELSGLIPLLTWTNTFLHNCRRTNRVWRVDGNVNVWTEGGNKDLVREMRPKPISGVGSSQCCLS